MAESIFQRVSRIVSGSIEDRVDAMERGNSDTVMRESIREADRAIDDVRSAQEKAATRRLQAARQQGMIAKRVEELQAKASFALQEGREDLAEGALSRQIDLEEQAVGLDSVQSLAREEEGRLEESLTALRDRKRQMEDALSSFEIAKTEASLGGDSGARNQQSIERQLERAEAAFDRAMTGAGGTGFDRGDVDAINKVAEIDAMHKGAKVASRLAALKLEVSKAA
jgi:phage shock protein A